MPRIEASIPDIEKCQNLKNADKLKLHLTDTTFLLFICRMATLDVFIFPVLCEIKLFYLEF